MVSAREERPHGLRAEGRKLTGGVSSFMCFRKVTLDGEEEVRWGARASERAQAPEGRGRRGEPTSTSWKAVITFLEKLGKASCTYHVTN